MFSTRAQGPTQLLQGSMSELAQAIFEIKSEPLTYQDQAYMVTAVDDFDYETVLMRTSRQVGKTVTQGVRATLLCAQVPRYNVLYVSPSFTQTKEFSKNRIDPFCQDSDFVRTELMDPACTWSQAEKRFKNGAGITFRYAYHHADRSRGLSMDYLEVDELQDINVENIPVLEQTLVHSKPPVTRPELAPFFKKKLYTGTPKSLGGTMEHFWKESTQCMWTVPCYSCGSWSQLTEKSIGKYGTTCTGNRTVKGGRRVTCGAYIDPRHGMWHAGKPDADVLGLHISQLMAPRVEWGPHGWIRWEKDIIAPMEGRAPGWDKVRFYNEILGFPCESAQRPVTEADMRAACNENWRLLKEPTPLSRSTALYAGVDWGETRSRTVLTIGGRFGPERKWHPVFMRQYNADECDPNFLIEDITKWCTLFGVRAIACDVGHGFGLNSSLVNQFGMDRIFPIRYGGKVSPRLAFASKNKWEWVTNRNTIMGELFMNIKRRRIAFPKWVEWEKYAKDFLNVFIEFSGRHKDMFFAHGVGLENADDTVHSVIYCQLAEEIARGSFTMTDDFY